MKKKYWEMNTAELAEATREFDQEFIADKARPLSPAGKAAHRRAAARGRPRVGKGAERINITVERGLLSRVDRFAKRLGLSRAQLVARALSRELRASAAERRLAS
ncbi:MAG TPA: hypothetical protein VL992_09140 [Tepidisphaeraceae bacterium]|nr:hypothetical protein [Tepidisphaeraceae bacterium]